LSASNLSGFLLALSRDWVILRASANLEQMLGIDPRAAIGNALDSWVDCESLHDIRNRMTRLSRSAAASNDFAVLDINSGFTNSLGLAAFLRTTNTPFVFASGYGEREVLGESRVSELTVAKPYDRQSLCNAIVLTHARSSYSDGNRDSAHTH
jgi:hypothetical protein